MTEVRRGSPRRREMRQGSEVKADIHDFLSQAPNLFRVDLWNKYSMEIGTTVAEKEEAEEFKEIMQRLLSTEERRINLANFLPILNWTAVGHEKKMKELGKKIDMFLNIDTP